MNSKILKAEDNKEELAVIDQGKIIDNVKNGTDYYYFIANNKNKIRNHSQILIENMEGSILKARDIPVNNIII